MKTGQRVLVTGADGFIGSYLCAFLKQQGFFVRGSLRDNPDFARGADEYIQVGPVNEFTDWSGALKGIDAVVHLAGRAHVINDQNKDAQSIYHQVNVLGTRRLAQQAIDAGIKRFIFMSSVKVYAGGSVKPYTENDRLAPGDIYGVSKQEAEDALTQITAKTGLSAVILRLPLVYGPGVKANFRQLLDIINTGLPLPLKGLKNKRSFLYVGNLADAVAVCITSPAAAGETFLLSDAQDVSVPQLVEMIAPAIGKKAVLFYLPAGILKILFKLSGKSAALEKLAGSQLVESGKIKKILGWNPPFTMEEGLKDTASWFKALSVPGRNNKTGRAKRIFDFVLAIILMVILSVPMAVIFLLVKLTSRGPAIFWTDRVGLGNRTFKMCKFRTMVVGTPQLATHLMQDAGDYLTPVGKILRAYSLDELPQLFNVIRGQMSFVGPRPALFNQDDLIALRTRKNIHSLVPGVTGWAQVNGRDDLPIPAKVALEEYYLNHRSFVFDIYIILLTLVKVIKKEGIRH